MKAVTRTEYGSPDVLRLEEIPTPTPGPNEALVRVHAASLTYGDWGLLTGQAFFLRFPAGGLRRPTLNILGGDIAGHVEAVGAETTLVGPGQAVFGDLADCGRGGFAEVVCAPEDRLAPMPDNVTFEEAAAAPLAAVVALQGLRDKGRIQAGQRVLINGASGGVGTFAVQIAKCFGAEVTAVCSTANLELALSLGADHVMDYTQVDVTSTGQRYDLILAANGYHPIAAYKRALTPQGTYVCSGGSLGQIFQSMLLGPMLSRSGGVQMGNLEHHPSRNDLLFVGELLETGQVFSVIDRRYPLNEVPEALRHFGEGHARGKVVITV